MELEKYIGKVIRVQIIKKKENYYIAKAIKENLIVYIEDEGDYLQEELIGMIEKCIIVKVQDGNLIGFIMSNRKFINDMKKIENDLKRQNKYKNVKDIYLMERLKINSKVAGLYIADMGDYGIYYLDTVEIGKYNKKLIENNIIFKERTIEDELAKQIRDIVISIDLSKKEISLREQQDEQKRLIEKALGLEPTMKITRIATIDLKEKIEEKEKQAQEIQRDQFVIEKQEKTIKDINIKQKMDTDNRVTDMENLGQILDKEGLLPQIEGKTFTKIGIIESDDRDKLVDENGNKAKVNTTRYSMVAIANDGSVVPLEMEQDHQEGNNPNEINYQVSQQGKIKQDDVLSRFNIGEGTISIKNGEYGEIKVYHSPRKTIGGKDVEGNKSLDVQLETDNVWQLKKEQMDLAEKYGDGYRSVEESYQEAKLHEDESGEIINEDMIKTKDLDGEKNTKSHMHDNIDYNKLASKWGYYKDSIPNSDKAKELFEEKRKQNPNKDAKEIIEMITDDLEKEFGYSRDER